MRCGGTITAEFADPATELRMRLSGQPLAVVAKSLVSRGDEGAQSERRLPTATAEVGIACPGTSSPTRFP